MPLFGYFTFLLTHRWDTAEAISRVKVPTLLVTGLKDLMMPLHMSQSLYDHCGSDSKEWKKFAAGGHMDTWVQPEYFDTIQKFVYDNTKQVKKLY